jgi:hypothetical protein
MTATAAQIAQVRRMTNEPTTSPYTDALVQGFIEAYPMLDELGEEPYDWDSSTSPPTKDTNDDWIPTYDLHAAAADIWEEKASVVSVDFDFGADGGSYSRSQVYQQYMKMCRYHRGRRKPTTMIAHVYPRETTQNPLTWVANRLRDID